MPIISHRRPLLETFPSSVCTLSTAAGGLLTGVSGFDPCKLVRMVLLGRDIELIESKLPWLCTLCGKCEHACLVNTQNEDMVHWWKIFHVSREDFTIPGENWGLFSRDDEAMKVLVGRIVAHMEKLNIYTYYKPGRYFMWMYETASR